MYTINSFIMSIVRAGIFNIKIGVNKKVLF